MKKNKKDKMSGKLPELDYIRRWSEAKNKKDALAILDEGIKFAKKRGSTLFIRHFRDLQRETKTLLNDLSDRGATIRERREVQITCSFCGKKRAEVSQMIAGAKAYICNQCVRLCYEITERPKI